MKTIKVMLSIPTNCTLTETKSNYKITLPKEVSSILQDKKQYKISLYYQNGK